MAVSKNTVSASAVNVAETAYSHKNGNIELNPPQASLLGDAMIQGMQTVSNIARGVLEYKAEIPKPVDPATVQALGVQGGVAAALDPARPTRSPTAKIINSAAATPIVNSINFNNKSQLHICEPLGIMPTKRTTIVNVEGIEVPNLQLGAPALELSILFKSADVQKVLGQIREAIESAFGDATSTAFTKFREAASYIATKLKEINRILKVYIVTALLIVQVEQFISLCIKFITSLPAVFAKAFAECLALLKQALAAALSFAVGGDVFSELRNQVATLQQYITLAKSATEQVIAGAQQIAQDIQNIPQGISAASDILASSISNFTNNPPKPVVNVTIF
jgi:vacuolar-type H+-ATPase subunit D/Vma8